MHIFAPEDDAEQSSPKRTGIKARALSRIQISKLSSLLFFWEEEAEKKKKINQTFHSRNLEMQVDNWDIQEENTLELFSCSQVSACLTLRSVERRMILLCKQ